MQGDVCMKEGRWLLILGITALVISFLPMHLLLPELVLMTGSFDLAPGGVRGPTLFVPLNSVAILDFTIDGLEQDVYFYITGGSSDRIFDAGRVYDRYHLEWASPGFSSYTFNFDNTMSSVNHKQVTYNLRVYPYSTIFLFLGIVLVVVAVLQIVREERKGSRAKGSPSGHPR